jgi:hypothetical protein
MTQMEEKCKGLIRSSRIKLMKFARKIADKHRCKLSANDFGWVFQLKLLPDNETLRERCAFFQMYKMCLMSVICYVSLLLVNRFIESPVGRFNCNEIHVCKKKRKWSLYILLSLSPTEITFLFFFSFVLQDFRFEHEHH